ncbi:hypothetical protein ABZ904_08585 [Streptomyces sp. NPDC046900]|uniref:hypothetical protein n=1 Tax=Streptomyces sp. NPDC046900 TaxID=3155473 RepID=UPI0033D19FA1
MGNRTDRPPEQPTPVADDAHATAPELLGRAAVDYADAQHRREQLSGEDRVHGNESGSAA